MRIFISENFKEEVLKNLFKKLDLEGKYSFDEFKKGMEIELEHGTKFGENTDITNDDPMMTAKIVLAHFKETPNYYKKLTKAGL